MNGVGEAVSAVPEVDRKAAARKVGKGKVFEASWARDARGVNPDVGACGVGCGICAVDVQGAFAGSVYRRVLAGVWGEDLVLEAPVEVVPHWTLSTRPCGVLSADARRMMKSSR